MKKLINDPDNVVKESLAGMAAAHPELRIDMDTKVVYRADGPVKGKVALISGGGSGHEPLHGGFVGKGMLDAAVAGEVFTSPTPDQVEAAIKGADGGAGVLLLIKNYTGDVINFQMAAELAQGKGIDVADVVIDDDVAVQDSSFTAGRRGVGLTVLLEKIVGAAAEEGRSLDDVKAVAEKIIANGRSMGVALTSATLPAVGKPSFDLPDDEIEMGVGIHGEPGRKRIKMSNAHEIAKELVDAITADLDFTDSPAIVMLNGMGATPLIELYLMYGEVEKLLAEKGIKVARNLVGNYITAIDMAGCSLTVLKADEDTLGLWDAPVYTPGLKLGSVGEMSSSDGEAESGKVATAAGTGAGAGAYAGSQAASDGEELAGDENAPVTQAHRERNETGAGITLSQVGAWVHKSSEVLSENKDYLTELDAAIGDSDHGSNMARGMKAAVEKLDAADPDSFEGVGKTVGMALVSSVGGASGPLYGTFFLRFGQSIGDADEVDTQTLAAAFRAGADGVKSRGKAELEDKTMLDVLLPVADVLEAHADATIADALASAVDAAKEGRDATKDLVAKKGRASYLGERSKGHIDPGSASAALIVEALASVVTES